MPDYTDAPYVRVWATLRDDHPAVWRDNDLLAWWLRLLVGARLSYPASAPYPRELPDAVETKLVELGVIDPREGGYRFHGLDALRLSEQPRGTAGGQARAREGVRDRMGRWLASAGGDAGNGAGRELDNPSTSVPNDAGGDMLAETPDDRWAPVAGRPATATRPREDRRRADPIGSSSDPPAYAGVRAPAPARGAPSDPGSDRTSRPALDPSRIRCDAYEEHRAAHHWIAGIGWLCSTCEAERAKSEPTFSEKVEAARQRAESDAPF